MFTSNNTFTMFLIQLLFCIYFVVLQSNLFRCWKAYYAKRENGWKGKDKLVTEVTSGCWHSSVKFTFLSWGGQGEADGLWGTWELLFLECRGEGDDIEKFHILKKKKKLNCNISGNVRGRDLKHVYCLRLSARLFIWELLWQNTTGMSLPLINPRNKNKWSISRKRKLLPIIWISVPRLAQILKELTLWLRTSPWFRLLWENHLPPWKPSMCTWNHGNAKVS